MRTAGELLRIWSGRLSMQGRGITKPSKAARNLTKLLVEKLSQLDSAEGIHVGTKSDGHLVRFIRTGTGEALAETAHDLPAKHSWLAKSAIVNPGELPPTRNVWSAAGLQAKSEVDGLVCANVFGLRWSRNSWPGWNALRFVPH